MGTHHEDKNWTRLILFNKYSSIFFLSVAFITIGFILLFLFHVELYDQLTSEDNVIENLSAVLLFLCGCFFLISFFHARKSPLKIQHWLSYGLLILSIVFFIIAGEEISWGQRIFDIATPDNLSSVNDQDELNFHNINKRFFDRLLDRATIVFVFISSFLLYRKEEKTLGIKNPDIFVVCSFAITPFYTQNTPLDFYHFTYVPLVGLFVFALKSKQKSFLFPLAFTLILSLIIIIIHTTYNHLFPWHNNSANELREFLFYLSCLAYAYEIMNDLKSQKRDESCL